MSRFVRFVSFALCFCGSSYGISWYESDGRQVESPPKLGKFDVLLLSQKRLAIFFVDNDGKLNRREETNGSLPIVEFFVHPTIVEEVELNSDQVEQIRAHFETMNRRIKEIRSSHSGSTPSEPSDGNMKVENSQQLIQDELNDEIKKFLDRSRGELSQKQNNRLKEIQWQFILLRNAVFNVVRDPIALQALEVEPISEAMADEGFQINKFVAQIQTEEKRILKEALDRWLVGLDNNQRELFYRDWRDVLNEPGALGQLVWQLEYDRWAPFVTRPQEQLLTHSLSKPHLLHGADGNVQIEFAKENIKYSELHRLYVFRRFITSELVRELAEIVEFQVEDMGRFWDKFDEYKNNVVAETAGEFAVPFTCSTTTSSLGIVKPFFIYDWPEDMSEIDAINEKKLSRKASECFDQMYRVLLPAQQKRLSEIISRIEARSRGPWADIEHGSLDKTLGLTSSQKSDLSAGRATCIDFIESETRLVACQTLDKVINEIREPSKSKLKSVIGEPIKTGHCDLTMLVFGFERHAND